MDQLQHANDWILYPQKIGPFLSIDEISLSRGELYTIITNKEAKGKKGTLVAMVKGINSDKVREIITKIPSRKKDCVKEVTLDIAASMEKIARSCFP